MEAHRLHLLRIPAHTTSTSLLLSFWPGSEQSGKSPVLMCSGWLPAPSHFNQQDDSGSSEEVRAAQTAPCPLPRGISASTQRSASASSAQLGYVQPGTKLPSLSPSNKQAAPDSEGASLRPGGTCPSWCWLRRSLGSCQQAEMRPRGISGPGVSKQGPHSAQA